MKPLFARLLLAAAVAVAAATTIATPKQMFSVRAGLPADSVSDDQLFKIVVGRMAAGEPYYPAMRAELQRLNYPTASVFNWRTPWLFHLISRTGEIGAWVLLGALCGAVMLLTVRRLQPLSSAQVLMGVLCLVGSLQVSITRPFVYQTEAWCGVLVGLSLLLYSSGRWTAGMMIAFAALMARELAAPYVVACVVNAVARRRRAELVLWAGAGAGYLLLYVGHVGAVAAQTAGSAAALDQSRWVQWGGLPFVAETMRSANSVLLKWPWLTGTFAGILTLAAWSRSAPWHLKAAVVAYFLFFLAVGQPFNGYWGLVAAPADAIAAAYGIGVLDECLRAARFMPAAWRATRPAA